MSRRQTLAAALVVCALLLTGCAGTPGDGPPTATSTTGQSGPETTGSLAETATGAGTPATTAGSETDTPEADDRTRPQVELRDGNGTVLGRVTVAIADTGGERYTGLSDTERLNESEGMLFVYEEPDTHTYVMRDMDFPLDILFIAPNGTITTIHHAPTEPGESGDELTGYPGYGQYVLEVNRGYANRTGLAVGDTVAIPARIATADATPNPDAES
ncbi:DUF192 domain-containing protein [Halorientalis pallida]|uniref:DUF192 domain-containing protein n=1 Tax=Halorientalis pallida TaxID=2479928 RepID=UPI003C6F52FC